MSRHTQNADVQGSDHGRRPSSIALPTPPTVARCLAWTMAILLAADLAMTAVIVGPGPDGVPLGSSLVQLFRLDRQTSVGVWFATLSFAAIGAVLLHVARQASSLATARRLRLAAWLSMGISLDLGTRLHLLLLGTGTSPEIDPTATLIGQIAVNVLIAALMVMTIPGRSAEGGLPRAQVAAVLLLVISTALLPWTPSVADTADIDAGHQLISTLAEMLRLGAICLLLHAIVRMTHETASGGESGEMSLPSARAAARILLIVILVVNVANLAAAIVFFGPGVDAVPFGQALDALFNVDLEGNLPNWVSTLLLVIVSALLWHMPLGNREPGRTDRTWRLLSLLALVLSIDEFGGVHEAMTGALGEAFPAAPLLPWEFLYVLAAAAILAQDVKVMSRLPRSFTLKMALSGVMYVAGGIIIRLIFRPFRLEMTPEVLLVIVTIEENLEMIGPALLTVVLLTAYARAATPAPPST